LSNDDTVTIAYASLPGPESERIILTTCASLFAIVVGGGCCT
jgi:hypothetical protein